MFPERCVSSFQMATARIIQQKGVASAEEEAVVGVCVCGGGIYTVGHLSGMLGICNTVSQIMKTLQITNAERKTLN